MFEAIIRPMHIRGRASRSAYWLAVCAAWIGIMAATPVLFFAEAFWGTERRTPKPSEWIALGLFVAVVLYCAWVMIAASARRLHDRDKGGWWVIPFVIIPIGVNELINFQTHIHPEMNVYQLILTWLTVALGLWGFIDIGCVHGTVRENRYGPVPLPAKWFAVEASETQSAANAVSE